LVGGDRKWAHAAREWNISSGDVGIFVSTGGFSPEARMEARTHRTHSLTLVDLQELIALWSRHYESIEQKDKHFLPLEVVYFLAEKE
jgi:restriction system protein